MNTFVPYADVIKSAKVLDNSRLNKQVLETVQILRVIDGEYKTNAWKNHPAVVQWHDHEYKLAYYGLMMEQEANKRGIKANQKEELKSKMIGYAKEGRNVDYPTWWGFEPLHASHRSNLMRKDKKYYSQFFDDEAGKPYIWIRDKKLQYGLYRSDIKLEDAKRMEEQQIWEEIIGKKIS